MLKISEKTLGIYIKPTPADVGLSLTINFPSLYVRSKTDKDTFIFTVIKRVDTTHPSCPIIELENGQKFKVEITEL